MHDHRMKEPLLGNPDFAAGRAKLVSFLIELDTRGHADLDDESLHAAIAKQAWSIHAAVEEPALAKDATSKQLQALSFTLKLLAKVDPERAGPAIERARKGRKAPTTGGYDQFASNLEEASRIARGIPSPDDALAAFERDPDSFPEPAQLVLCVYIMLGDIAGDGLQLFFANKGGFYNLVRDGLDLLGLKKEAKIFTEARAQFDVPEGVDEDDGLREAWENLTPEASEALEALGNELDESNDAIHDAIADYMAAHPEQFRPKPQGKKKSKSKGR